MNLHPSYRLYAFGPPASPEELAAFARRYAEVPPGYPEAVMAMTDVVLLWNRRCELRLWSPQEAMGLDDAYGVSRAMPGAVPIGDNGGGRLLVHGNGTHGPGLYLVEAGALFFEDADWIAADLEALLGRGEGAETIFVSDPLDEEALAGAPFFDERDDRRP